MGTELSVLDVKLPDGDLDLRLHVLDTGGHPAQLKLMQDSVGTSHNFCCLVYSVVDKDTFASIKTWYSMMADRVSRNSKRLQGVLIGNKMDMPAGTHQVGMHAHSSEWGPCDGTISVFVTVLSQQVTSEMGDHLAKELGLTHMRISATKFDDSEAVFQTIAQLISEEYRGYLASMA